MSTPNSLPTIRPATPNDVPEILAMIAELADFENLTHLLIATESDFQSALFGEKTAAEALVVEHPADPEKLIGYAIFFPTFSTFVGKAGIWLEDIYVRPDFRGLKIGKLLLKAVATIAENRNAGRLEWCVLDWNQRAIDFYQNIGADVMPEWRICRLDHEGIAKFANSVQNPHGSSEKQ